MITVKHENLQIQVDIPFINTSKLRESVGVPNMKPDSSYRVNTRCIMYLR